MVDWLIGICHLHSVSLLKGHSQSGQEDCFAASCSLICTLVSDDPEVHLGFGPFKWSWLISSSLQLLIIP